MKIRNLAVAGLAAIGLLASAAGTATAGTQAKAGFTYQPNESYAGWSVHPAQGVTSLTATWTIPKVECGNAPFGTRAWHQSRAATWIGMWGSKNNKNWKLAQVGTISSCYLGRTWADSYTVFAEMYPDQKQQILPLQVKPGEEVRASMFYRGPETSGPYKGQLAFDYYIWKTSDGGVGPYGRLHTKAAAGDVTYQGGAVVEDEPYGGTSIGVFGGLAQFTTPVKFTNVVVNYKDISQYAAPDLIRWDMYNTVYVAGKANLGKEALAITYSSPPPASGFTVTWKHWN